MFRNKILSKSRMSTTSPASNYAKINYESSEEMLPQNPENTTPSAINDINSKTGANQWIASKFTSFKRTMLSTIFEESLPTTPENQQACPSSNAENATTKNTVEDDSTPFMPVKVSGKTEVAPRNTSRSYSQKSSSSFHSRLLEKSISKRKTRKRRRLPREQVKPCFVMINE